MSDLYFANVLGWTGHFYNETPAKGEPWFWAAVEAGCLHFRLAKWRGCVSRVLVTPLRDYDANDFQEPSERRDAA